MSHRPVTARPPSDERIIERRIWSVGALFFLGGMVLVARFFQLQVLEHKVYQLLASDEHVVASALIPRRGTISFRDARNQTLEPVALDREQWTVTVNPRQVKNVSEEAQGLASALQLAEPAVEQMLQTTSSRYLVLAKDVPLTAVDTISQARWPGVSVEKQLVRDYPAPGLGGQVLGFVSQQDVRKREGIYGVEGFYNQVLAGQAGHVVAEKDAYGRQLAFGSTSLQQAVNGSDLVLTLDPTIQYTVCQTIKQAVQHFEAVRGTIIVMDPQTGAMYAMCSAPDFEPADYGNVSDVSVYNNLATLGVYEPGSIFKAVTMGAGIDTGKITPQSTFVDTGSTQIDGFTVHDSDHKAHGLQTMTQVLDESLNLGTIFVERQVGREAFREFILRFGFGQKMDIDIDSEAHGDVTALNRKGEIFTATTSFGQGISVTPLQMAVAYAAFANGGFLVKPHLVSDIIRPDGIDEKQIAPAPHRIMDSRTAQLVTAMMIDVVEHGHGKHAGVPGYYVAGKTGTAQIPDPKNGGYLTSKDGTIGTFAGFAPATHPKFVMLVRLDRPANVNFAESSAAPVFGQLANFLLNYFQIPPERPIAPNAVPTSFMPVASSTKP